MPFGAAKAASAASGLDKLFRLEVSQWRSRCDSETSIVPDNPYATNHVGPDPTSGRASEASQKHEATGQSRAVRPYVFMLELSLGGILERTLKQRSNLALEGVLVHHPGM